MLADEILVFRNGKWVEGGTAPSGQAGFVDIRGYYANLIGYARVLLCLIAAFTAIHQLPWLTAALLIASTLLDWIDGPVARRANQCSIFGSGVDWFADIMAQIVTMGWLVAVLPAALPWMALATAVELCNCIFDFATAATGRYPKAPARLRDRSWFFVILDWSMPGGSYTILGNTLWLAYPLCLLAWCLRFDRIGLALLPLAALYIWCELAWTVFIVANWAEPARTEPVYADCPAGFRHLGFVPERTRGMLTAAARGIAEEMAGPCADNRAEGRIFWINIWQRSRPEERMRIEGVQELDRWAHDLVAEHYAGEGVALDGYGTIVNPVGSHPQEWHIDYASDYSTIFIPMSPLTPENTMQYAVLPDPPAAFDDPDCVDLTALSNARPWVSIRQLIAPCWSLLRMDFGAIHRGIANTGSFDRHMFWVSVKKGALLPPEPSLAAIADVDVVVVQD
jgi:phosphatidylglycerophosphate synthase